MRQRYGVAVHVFAGLLGMMFTSAVAAAPPPTVRLTTTAGTIDIELDRTRAPRTVDNFLAYVRAGFYDGTIFHRVIPGFMIQGGGFNPGMKEKATRAPIPNEADNGLKNLAGTIAMARTPDPHSASAQFFINTVDNAMLDHRGKNPRDWGYAVFGRVVRGMDVVKKIEGVPTTRKAGHDDVPQQDVMIKRAQVLKPVAKAQKP
jgi:cyclophilin family peptidyl-prolyl cis-trans isomerase